MWLKMRFYDLKIECGFYVLGQWGSGEILYKESNALWERVQ